MKARARELRTILAQGFPAPTAARHREYDRITDGKYSAVVGPFTIPAVYVCGICGQDAECQGTTEAGITDYRCVDRHLTRVDHSRQLRLRL